MKPKNQNCDIIKFDVGECNDEVTNMYIAEKLVVSTFICSANANVYCLMFTLFTSPRHSLISSPYPITFCSHSSVFHPPSCRNMSTLIP